MRSWRSLDWNLILLCKKKKIEIHYEEKSELHSDKKKKKKKDHYLDNLRPNNFTSTADEFKHG